MKTYIAIPILSDNNNVAEILNKLVGSLYTEIRPGEYKENCGKGIYIYDVTEKGINRELAKFIRSYSKYGVYYRREKVAKNYPDPTSRMNIALGSALRHFNSFGKANWPLVDYRDTFSSFIWISQNVYFENFDLQLFADQAQIYHAISPVVCSVNGLEVYKGIFDRFGVEYLKLDDPIDFITGQVEETYALNPKCFALSKHFARKLKDFVITDEDTIKYLNSLVYDHADIPGRLQSDVFVHEHLY
jgi:hypothetical protein